MNKQNKSNLAEEAKKIIAFIEDADNTSFNLQQLRTGAAEYFWQFKVRPVLLDYTSKKISEYTKKHLLLEFSATKEGDWWQLYNKSYKGIHIEWDFKDYRDFVQRGCIIKEGTFVPFVFHVEWNPSISSFPIDFIYNQLVSRLEKIKNSDTNEWFELEIDKKQTSKGKKWISYTLIKTKAKQDIHLYKVEDFVSCLFDWDATKKMIAMLVDDDFIQGLSK